MGVYLSTAGATGTIWGLGLYSATGPTGGAIIPYQFLAGATSGSLNGSATILAIPYSIITPGWYWLSWLCGDITQRSKNGSPGVIAAFLGVNNMSNVTAFSYTCTGTTGAFQQGPGLTGITPSGGTQLPIMGIQVGSVP